MAVRYGVGMEREQEQFISDRFDLVTVFPEGLDGETDRGCALMAAEYLSNQLGELLRAYFVDDAEACDSVLEGGNATLSTFSARIDLAYLLGLVGPAARRELGRRGCRRESEGRNLKPQLQIDGSCYT